MAITVTACHNGNHWHPTFVVGDSTMVLADRTVGVCARRVEVTQRDVANPVAPVVPGEGPLEGQLRLTVGVRR